MRLLGSFMLAVCCVLWGLDRSKEVKHHLHRLEAAELFWRGIRGELLARRPTPTELFISRAADPETAKTLPFVTRTAQALERGVPYPVAFTQGMEPPDQWTPEELACQRRLGSVVGQLPLEEQLDSLQLLVDTLTDYRNTAREQLHDRCKMYRSLGLAAGAAVMILLV